MRDDTDVPRRDEAAVSRRTLRAHARSLVRTAESCWYHPDGQRPWIRPAFEATLKAVARNRPDVLWATGPPFSAFVVAGRVAQQTGIPYVLDFRTSWTVVPSPFEARRPGWAQRRDRTVLRRLLTDAQAVVFFYAAEAECFWRMYRGALDPSRIHLIPNGFDGDVKPFVPSTSDKFTILYTGTLADYGFEGFLDALALFVRRDPMRAQQTSVRFVGEVEPSLVRRVQESGLSDVVTVQPPVSHAAAGTMQQHADVLLMLERRPSHKGHELLAGAKLFEYLKTGKPILGVVPEGEAMRILHEVGVTTVAPASSIDAIGRVLDTLFSQWCDGTLECLIPDRERCERYSAKAQTPALVRALEGAPALSPFVPGTMDVAPSLRAEYVAEGWA